MTDAGEKLTDRAQKFMDDNFPIVGDDMEAFARAELERAAEIAADEAHSYPKNCGCTRCILAKEITTAIRKLKE